MTFPPIVKWRSASVGISSRNRRQFRFLELRAKPGQRTLPSFVFLSHEDFRLWPSLNIAHAQNRRPDALKVALIHVIIPPGTDRVFEQLLVLTQWRPDRIH